MSRKFFVNLFFILSLAFFGFFLAPDAKAASSIQTGDFFQAFNNTTQEGTWRDPVTAQSGQIVEFRVTVRNTGDAPAERVQVWGSVTGQLPQDPAGQLVVTAKIHNASYGGVSITDTATINVTGTPEGMRYVPGHARINGVTNLYNCANTCPLGDSVISGIDIGDVAPGDFVEVTFKGTLTNTPPPSAPPSVSPSAPPSAPPSAAPQAPAGGNVTNNITNNNTNTNTNTNSANANANVNITNPAVPAAAARVLGVSAAPAQLPKTGLPALALVGFGLTPLGLVMKRFMKGSEISFDETFKFITEKRILDKMG